jgi:hypothetical protein
MGFTQREIGHMTTRKFSRYYKAYKQNFDTELCLLLQKKTYSQLEEEMVDDEDWIK